MKNFFCFFLLICLYPTDIVSQTKTPSSPFDSSKVLCGSDEIHKKLMETDSVYRKKNEEFEKLMATINTGKIPNKHLPVYKIPVVFHVINAGDAMGSESNLTNQQISGAVRYINSKLQENSVKFNDSLGVVLRLEPSSTDVNIIRHEIKKRDYVKNGLALEKNKGVTVEKLKTLIKSNESKGCTIYLVNKINGQSCSSHTNDKTEGYVHLTTNSATTTDDTFILGCAFSNINNNSFLSSELINSLILKYIITKKQPGSKTNYEIFFQNKIK